MLVLAVQTVVYTYCEMALAVHRLCVCADIRLTAEGRTLFVTGGDCRRHLAPDAVSQPPVISQVWQTSSPSMALFHSYFTKELLGT